MTITINIPNTAETQLQIEAERTGTSIAAVIEQIVSERFGSLDFGSKSVAELIEEIGYIETVGKSDMARNPEKYMKGFGETSSPRELTP